MNNTSLALETLARQASCLTLPYWIRFADVELAQVLRDFAPRAVALLVRRGVWLRRRANAHVRLEDKSRLPRLAAFALGRAIGGRVAARFAFQGGHAVWRIAVWCRPEHLACQ